MPSFNRVILIGRLTRDPELRYTASGLAVTTFSIAVDRFQKNEQGERVTDFFRCKAWRQKAEFVQQYIHKGRLVAVEGRIELSEYTAQDGTRRTAVDIICDGVETLESPRDGAGGGEGGAMPARQQGAPQGAPQGGPQGGADGGEYFDDEVAAAPARSQGAPQGGPAAPQQRPQAAAPAARPQGAPQDAPQGAPRPQAAPQGGAADAPARGAQAQPAYPKDDYDFDDSDPFADE